MDINKRIFEVLDEKGISQKELSKRTGISESTISDWKRKGKTPGIDKLILLCEKLNVDIYSLAGIDYEYQLDDDEKLVIDMYRSTDPGSRKRLLAYIKSFENISSLPLINDNSLDNNRYNKNVDSNEIFQPDQFFLQQKLMAKKLRKLAKLDRIKLDETEHASKLNLHLLKYLDYIGIDKLEYIKQYLSNIQPFMISEIKSQEKFDNSICILDEFYRISVYIKLDATFGEEIIVSFHENNKSGVARRNTYNSNLSYVYVFADSIGSHVNNTDYYTVNLFITRGVSTFPINVPASKYDADGFLVRYTYINNAIIDISNRYLEDLYTSDIDFSSVELFTDLQQLSFTSYGNETFSNISLLIDSLIIQKNVYSKQIADTAMCIYCNSLDLLESDKKELIETLKERYKVNSVKALPQIIERIELNLL
ncbi:MAG: helix-turn-helix transcriptional regulator [Butyrivibrio sp.]|nr:helix-turn-helix transcriptional regulator [Butyrivibrio sp.]